MVDDLDLRILKVLDENSRLSFAEIGRIVGLSPSAARERVQKMEGGGIIKNYRVVTNNQLLGYDIEAFISVKVFHGKLKSFINTIGRYPQVKRAFRVTGEQNLMLEVIAKDRMQLQSLIDQIMEFGDSVTQLVLSEVELKDNHR